MTVRELYKWAEECDALDFSIEIQHRDDGGCYYGVDDLDDPYIADREHSYNTERWLTYD